MLLSLAAAVACVSPVAFGAVAGDGRGDEQAIAAALAEARARPTESGAVVCFPAGVFELGRTAQIASLVIDGGVAGKRGGGKASTAASERALPPVILRGVGPETILRMTGDGRQGDWRGIELRGGARGVTFEDLRIDSLGTHNTEEQTHLVQLSPGVSRVTFRRVQLGPMRKPGQAIGEGSGGDCLRLVGEADAMIEDVVISRSAFVDCDRSGVSLQRGLRRIVIAGSTMHGTGDSPIDFEPTAPGPIEDVSMIDLRIFRDERAQGSWAIAIGGYGDDVATRITVAGCTLVGGGVGMLNVGEVVIAGNDIRHGSGAAPTISVRRRAARVRIEENQIVRPASAPPAALVEAQHNNGLSPTELILTGNQLRQETSAPVVNSHSVARLEISGNRIQYAGADAQQFVIDTHATAADAGRIALLDNSIRGAARAALRLDARNRKVSGVEVRGNAADGLGDSVACEAQPTGTIAKVAVSGNDFGSAASPCEQAGPSPAR